MNNPKNQVSPKEKWLIDGCNLLHSLKLGQAEFFAKVADFAAAERRKVLVVLDGSGNDEELETYRTALFRVVYCNAPSADAYLERTLCENKGRENFIVVTRDRAILQMARGMGARTMEPSHWEERWREVCKERKDILFRHEAKAHRFHRPFEGKL
jgi:predicted RNA-binding protein with PIN domain